MPEAIVEPPTQEPPKVNPVAPERWGDKFRTEFAKLSTAEQPTPAEPKADVTPTPVPPTEPTPAPTVETPIQDSDRDTKKPESPLEAALKEDAPVKTEEKPDIISEFDKVEKPTGDNWKAARETMKRQSEELKVLKAAPKPDLPAIEALTKERDEIKAKFQEQETRLKAVNAEYSDDFQALLREKNKTLSKIDKHLKFSNVENPEILMDALNLRDGKYRTAQIKEAVSALDEVDRTAVLGLIRELEDKDEAIHEFRKDLPAKFEEIQSRRAAKEAEDAVQSIKNLETQFDKVKDGLPKLNPTLRMVAEDVPGAAEWNKPIQEATVRALQVLKPGGADFNKTVAIAVKGELYDDLEKRYITIHKELVDARARLKEFDGASPDFKGGKPSTTEAPKKPGQIYREAFAKLSSAAAAEI